MADERANAYLVRMRDTTMTKRAILEKFAFYRQLPKTDQLALFDLAREVAPSNTTRRPAASSMGYARSVPTTVAPCAAMGAALRASPQPTSRRRSLGRRASSARMKARRISLAAAVEKPRTTPASSQRPATFSGPAPSRSRPP